MQISLKAQVLKQLMADLGSNFYSHISHRFGAVDADAVKNNTVVELTVQSSMSNAMLVKFREALNDTDETTAKRMLTQLIRSATEEVKSFHSFEALKRGLETALKANKHLYLFSALHHGRGIAYLPVSVEVLTATQYRSEHLYLELAYVLNGHKRTHTVTFNKNDLSSPLTTILHNADLIIPTDEMVEDYEKLMTKYTNYLQRDCAQFWARGTAYDMEASWWRSKEYNLSPGGRKTRVVLNTPLLKERVERFHCATEIIGGVRQVPEHPMLPVFSLTHHVDVLLSVSDLRPYKYEVDIGERLVLPESHSLLIGALVSNLDALTVEDDADDRSRILKAKSSCSLLIARGPAGTGKTLTAEVYAEQIQRPLYEVHSGQLGDGHEVEEKLQIVLDRAITLNMPLVINEADVFVKKRGDDMAQNAVCATFLRLLEYHVGLVWLTTNRDDIDDAIRSRAIAEIKYDVPRDKERRRLWEIQLRQFNTELPKEDIKAAVSMFPTVVGRDIQNLIRLTLRVCLATNNPFSLDMLKQNAVFKGIEVAGGTS